MFVATTCDTYRWWWWWGGVDCLFSCSESYMQLDRMGTVSSFWQGWEAQSLLLSMKHFAQEQKCTCCCPAAVMCSGVCVDTESVWSALQQTQVMCAGRASGTV
jgi:hypothetical protein